MDPLTFDYAETGLNLAQARSDFADRMGLEALDTSLPVLWHGEPVFTSFHWGVPDEGRLRIRVESADPARGQGVDVRIPDGWLELPDGRRLPRLWTWYDPAATEAEYRYVAPRGYLLTGNLYERTDGGPQDPAEEQVGRWGPWAGMTVRRRDLGELVFHCNDGYHEPPEFTDLVYALRVTE